jgi:hypothetical protein
MSFSYAAALGQEETAKLVSLILKDERFPLLQSFLNFHSINAMHTPLSYVKFWRKEVQRIGTQSKEMSCR